MWDIRRDERHDPGSDINEEKINSRHNRPANEGADYRTHNTIHNNGSFDEEAFSVCGIILKSPPPKSNEEEGTTP
jgi:hypothetical protein